MRGQCVLAYFEVVAAIIGSKVFVANAGDSRAIAVRSKNGLCVEHINILHTPDLPAEKERIERVGGFYSIDNRCRLVELSERKETLYRPMVQ